MSTSTEVNLANNAHRRLPGKRMIQRLRVPIALTLALLLLYFSKPSLTTILLGCSLAFVGLLFRAWATGYIHKDQQLAVTGPYAHMRNPLYFGSFLIGIGFTFASGVWWIALIFIGYFLSAYIPVMQAESVRAFNPRLELENTSTFSSIKSIASTVSLLVSHSR